jgi:hypothetical protein
VYPKKQNKPGGFVGRWVVDTTHTQKIQSKNPLVSKKIATVKKSTWNQKIHSPKKFPPSPKKITTVKKSTPPKKSTTKKFTTVRKSTVGKSHLGFV